MEIHENLIMKYFQLTWAIAIIVLLAGCKKDSAHQPEEGGLKLIELNNKQVLPGEYFYLDLDSNAVSDFVFGQSEYFSVIEQAFKLDFHINSYKHSFVLSPLTDFLPPLAPGVRISNKTSADLEWCNISQLNLVTKTTVPATGVSGWVGSWINQSNQYIPVKIFSTDNKTYLGWIEVSMNIETEIITVHRAALSRAPERDVKMGEL